MLFNSLHFLFFFILVSTTYFLVPHNYRWALLLAASCYFYIVFVPIYILILAFTIVVDYSVGIFLENAKGKKKKLFLIASIFTNLSVLAFFKYFNFFNQNLTVLLYGMGYKNPIPYLSILLPLGLSFHTFQAMSYTIEIYRGHLKAEKNFGIFSLYIMFYPQLVAGPIERPQNLLPQFYEKHYFDYHRITDGLKLMAWGLFKKVVIADQLAVMVDNVYDMPNSHAQLSFLIAAIFYSFQIFCDFSGYIDMAIGAAQVMGFRLTRNFNHPFHSKSIQEFWGRWNISLSSWFRDYLYISIGGNKVTIPRWYLNIFIVFLVSGLWHGANLTYIIWGGLHGFFVVFGLMTIKIRTQFSRWIGLNKIPAIADSLQVLTTFSLFTFALIFFRAKSVHIAGIFLKKMVIGINETLYNLFHHHDIIFDMGVSQHAVVFGFVLILFMEMVHIMQSKYRLRDWIASKPVYLRWCIYYVGVLSIIFLGVENKQFIYFQF